MRSKIIGTLALAAGMLLAATGSMGPPNPSLSGLRAAGFISNCPVVALIKDKKGGDEE